MDCYFYVLASRKVYHSVPDLHLPVIKALAKVFFDRLTLFGKRCNISSSK